MKPSNAIAAALRAQAAALVACADALESSEPAGGRADVYYNGSSRVAPRLPPGVSADRFLRACRTGAFPVVRDGKQRIVRVADWNGWVARKGSGAARLRLVETPTGAMNPENQLRAALGLRAKAGA